MSLRTLPSEITQAEKACYQEVQNTFNPYCYLKTEINPLSPELNPICYLLALLAHDYLHVSRIRVKSLMYLINTTKCSLSSLFEEGLTLHV
jgi:transposase